MKKKTGLGKGLSALIPSVSEEDLKNGVSLEDILNKNNDLKKNNKNKSQKNSNENLIRKNEENSDKIYEKIKESEDENVKDVLRAIKKNPRITLWSSKSAAVLRYLRKTRPEFSISKEASILMDEAISNKYPEIWELFEDLN
ncbi:MAG: AAA family ATPase [Methanobrevibacter sp.]|jgi:hypothetical protein|nr:AAA family ATPase [Candidatus Methanovirga aequatorialis]